MLRSRRSSTEPSFASKKLGQPVPEPNWVTASKSSVLQPAHWKAPFNSGSGCTFTPLKGARSPSSEGPLLVESNLSLPCFVVKCLLHLDQQKDEARR